MQQLALTDAFPDERPILGPCEYCGEPVREGDPHKANAAVDYNPLGHIYATNPHY